MCRKYTSAVLKLVEAWLEDDHMTIAAEILNFIAKGITYLWQAAQNKCWVT